LKKAYPIILKPAKIGYVVYVPDLDINTQGKDIADAMEMARDAIGLWVTTEEDLGRVVPEPSLELPHPAPDEIITLVDIDFAAYRRANENRTVRKNLSLPGWLNERAEKAGINFSQVLQEALKARLNHSQQQ